MASEKPKVLRSLIPISTNLSNSLQKLPQITSQDKCKSNSSKLIGITTSTQRKVTRNVSLSRLPTRGSTSAKSCPSIVKSICDHSNGRDNTLRSDLTSLSSSSKVNSSVKFIAKKSYDENQDSSQHIRNSHNTHIFNKFSPYEQQSIDYSNESIFQSNKTLPNTCVSKRSQSSELDLSISSAESCLSRDKPENQSGIDSNDSLLYRTQSVPERMVTKVYANDENWVLLEKSLIRQLNDKLELNNDNNEESDEKDNLESSFNDININVPPNVENKLLRIVIRHLREQLRQSKYSIEKLTQQLSSNKDVTEAFQKSLSAMTIRAQQLKQQLDDKENQIDSLLIDINDRKFEIEDLNKKVLDIDSELRIHRKSVSNKISTENISRNSSLMSVLSLSDNNDQTEDKKLKNKWLLGSTLRKAFKRKEKNQPNTLSKCDIESVIELKNMLKEKDMMITDLRLGSLATSHRLEQLEDALENSREETSHLKRNKDFLEKMMKLKIID